MAPMDDQLYREFRSRFDSIDKKLETMCKSLQEHIDKDEGYWRRLDDTKAQVRLVKIVGGSGLVGSGLLWIYQRFFH